MNHLNNYEQFTIYLRVYLAISPLKFIYLSPFKNNTITTLYVKN